MRLCEYFMFMLKRVPVILCLCCNLICAVGVYLPSFCPCFIVSVFQDVCVEGVPITSFFCSYVVQVLDLLFNHNGMNVVNVTMFCFVTISDATNNFSPDKIQIY